MFPWYFPESVGDSVKDIEQKLKKKDVNRDSHIAYSPITQSCFFKEVRCLILASSQRKPRGYTEFL